ncbi:hypothetical protein Tco_0608711 [Tanacetum coccineum]
MDTTTERDNPFAELITKNTRSRKGIFKNLHVQMIFEDLFHSQIQEKLNHLPKPEQDQVFTHSQHVDKKPGDRNRVDILKMEMEMEIPSS